MYRRLQASLDYEFDDTALLGQALTHRSAAAINNERLEFLGDAVLGFVVAEALFRAYPDASEADLTIMRASLVKKDTLASVARAIQLGEHLELGSGERKNGGRDRSSILADALEAVIGAVIVGRHRRRRATGDPDAFQRQHRSARRPVGEGFENETPRDPAEGRYGPAELPSGAYRGRSPRTDLFCRVRG